ARAGTRCAEPGPRGRPDPRVERCGGGSARLERCGATALQSVRGGATVARGFGGACEDRRVRAASGERVVVELPTPLDLRGTLSPLGHGPFDPAYRTDPDGVA